MKKFLLTSFLVFGFATLSADTLMTFEKARNYCNDLGGRLPTEGELQQACKENDFREFWTLDGRLLNLNRCEAKRGRGGSGWVICVKK